MRVSNKFLATLIAAILLNACGGGQNGMNAEPTTSTGLTLDGIYSVGYTYNREDGNRLVGGTLDMPNTTPVTLDLEASPQWVSGVSGPTGVKTWFVVLSNGKVQVFDNRSGSYQLADVTIRDIPSTMPPAAISYEDGSVALANPDIAAASVFTSPAILKDAKSKLVYVTSNGYVVVDDGVSARRIKVDAMPYARPLLDGAGRIAVVSKPSSRYDHQVLGNHKNAQAIAILNTQPDLALDKMIDIPAPYVIEGNALIWTDTNGDGSKEFVVTLADNTGGAFIAIYDEDGVVLAESDAIGMSHRWRHQIAVAPFSDSQLQIAATLTPHIGGKPEFFAIDGDKLEKIGSTSGYTSHFNGRHNIDTGLAGDFDNDGQLEMLLTNDQFLSLGAVSLAGTNVSVDWTIELNGSLLYTNLATITDASGGLSVAVGLSSNKLLIWE